MTTLKSILGTSRLFFPLIFLSLVFNSAAVTPADTKLELQLIWGTNDPQSPDPKHKPLEPELAKKMEKSPYKWKNYFEVNRQAIQVAPNATQKSKMSPQCEVEVKNLSDGRIEVKLFGNGKEVSKHIHPLANGLLIVGGDCKNDTAWFVMVKPLK
ncbi:MAG: hypothetical protein M3Y82_15095 [Verrucomicrobiota bacterium]|nr:hypothetical protein [Verrucomicrobiota bacterium]